tara:strand:+ start:508 stop:864 length:357 start_codon:yes stop_codon:yes gene_type:complete
MGRKRHPIYDVDRETQKLLEACLNLAAQTAQMQITEEGVEDIFTITDSIASRFNIETRIVEIEDERQDMTRSLTIYAMNEPGKPQPVANDTSPSGPPVINGNVFPFPFRVIDGDRSKD